MSSVSHFLLRACTHSHTHTHAFSIYPTPACSPSSLYFQSPPLLLTSNFQHPSCLATHTQTQPTNKHKGRLPQGPEAVRILCIPVCRTCPAIALQLSPPFPLFFIHTKSLPLHYRPSSRAANAAQLSSSGVGHGVSPLHFCQEPVLETVVRNLSIAHHRHVYCARALRTSFKSSSVSY